MTQTYGATRREWNHFCSVLALEADLLPVVSDPSAVIAPKSKIKKVGKTPSRYNQKGEVVGITEWTDKQASLDDIDRWERNPNYGICLQTRKIRAIDVDIPHTETATKIMKEIFALVGKLPVRMRKNSSKFVVAFQLDGDYSKRVIRSEHGLIEFLATGQQFVACGTHDSGVRYEWVGGLPDAFPILAPDVFEQLFTILAETYALEPPTVAGQRNAKKETLVIDDPISRFLQKEGFVISSGREGQLFIACPWKANHTGDSGETETSYFTAGTRGYKQGHFKCLHAHCANKGDADFLEAFGYGVSDYEDVSTPEEKADEKKKKNRFALIRADDYLKRAKVEWLVKGIMPMRSAGMTYGGSGDGKTFVVLDLACHVALGLPWNGNRVKRGRVVYICAEGAGGFMSRIQAYAKHHEIDLKDLGDYLSIIPASPNFLKKEDVTELAKEIKKQYPDTAMIVVDTLAQTSTGGDENSAKDMNIMLKNVEHLRDLTGACSHLIHHTGKDEERGARGSTALKADCDFQFSVSREGEQRLFWVAKMKDGPDNFGWHFKLLPVDIGVDEEDGEVITSCVCVFDETRVEVRKQKRIKASEKEDAIMAVAGDVATPLREFTNQVLATIPMLEEDKKKERGNILKTIGQLTRKGVLHFEDGKVSIPLDSD